MEEELRADIENVILPTFIHETVQSVEWGEPSIQQETTFVRLIVNGKPYLLVEDDTDGLLKTGDPADWLNDYWQDFNFTETEKMKLGPPPKNALRSSKPSISDWISTLEYHDGHPIEYMLFVV